MFKRLCIVHDRFLLAGWEDVIESRLSLLQLIFDPILALSSQIAKCLPLIDGYDWFNFVKEVPSMLLHDLLLAVDFVEGMLIGLTSHDL